MNALSDYPCLDSSAKCAALWQKYPEKVVGMWASVIPRQNVDVLWRLRQELIKIDVPVVFFFRESAKNLLRKFLAHESSCSQRIEDIYQLNDAKLFGLLDFIEVLVTSDNVIGSSNPRQVRAKTVALPHNSNLATPSISNYHFDYIVSDSTHIDHSFNYSIYPDEIKIHRNPNLSVLATGSPKIDLLVEEREKNALSLSSPLLLLYPTAIENAMSAQNIGPDKWKEIWWGAASAFFSCRPNGLVVFRPMTMDLCHPAVEGLRADFSKERFFIDEEDDNKFWLARADYFVTDISASAINFSMTAKRPSIRMIYTLDEEEPKCDELGWQISRPTQLIPLLEEMDRDEKIWTESLSNKQKYDMPNINRTFPILAKMIKRILNNDDDPGWHTIDKGHTPCKTSGDLLRFVAKWERSDALPYLNFFLAELLKSTAIKEPPQLWLLLLKRAFLTNICDLIGFETTPSTLTQLVNIWMKNAIDRLPLMNTVGILRYAMRRCHHNTSIVIFMTIASNFVPGCDKRRTLFFYLMESVSFDRRALTHVNEMAVGLPQHFSKPVLLKLNRFLPLVMKFPLPLRRFAARILGLRKTLAKNYWRAHRALCLKTH